MKKVFGWLFVVVLLGAGLFAYFLWQQGPTFRQRLAPPDEAPAPPVAAKEEPAIHYPVPEGGDQPLPALGKSDPAAFDALADVFGAKAARQLFQPQEIIRRIVVTIDNLPRNVVSGQLMPTRAPAGTLRTTGEGQQMMLSEANHARYTPFIRMAGQVDAKVAVDAYTRFYPLFQQAYRELGYPKGYFNDRLIAVIDHMLDAPASKGSIFLEQPRVFFKFADPQLESLSAGHKLMLRIGNENAAIIKKKLREFRAELVSVTPKVQ